MASIKTPDCRVYVYNLSEREGTNLPKSGIGFVPSFEEIDVTDHIIAIQTSKAKSSPSGTFNLDLAPVFNWVSEISVGSWIVILIDSKPISELSSKLWDSDSLKFIGRIDSVRAKRQVDQQTGAYITSYSIQGRDWACALESLIYISGLGGPGPGSQFTDPNSGFGQAAKLVYNKEIERIYKASPSTSDLTNAFLSIWGAGGNAFNITANLSQEIADLYMPFSPILVPTQIGLGMSKPAFRLVDHLEKKYGVLVSEGKYKDSKEAIGIFDISKVIGTNSLWQMLNSVVTAGGINEIFGDLSFDSPKRPRFTIYKRVRPFSLNNGFGTNSVEKSIRSSFFLLPKTKIKTEDIIGLDIGCNWSDVINFIKINWETSMFPFYKDMKAVYDSKLGVYSVPSYSLSGFKPLVVTTSMISGAESPSVESLQKWLPVLKEWYFDTHKMLNGTMVMSGNSGYIGVGNNILFPASAVSGGNFIEVPRFIPFGDSEQYVLAHVEVVSHSFIKSPNGNVNYTTSIQFVRGIITDEDGNSKSAKGSNGFGVDSDAPETGSRANSNVIRSK